MDDLYVDEIAIPHYFRCPVSLDLMTDPVTLSTGITYDRPSIETWLESGNSTCPVTKQDLDSASAVLIPNHTIRKMIQSWCVQNGSSGVVRIPTPRIPVTPCQVSEACRRISAAARRGDAGRCREMVAKINAWAAESERNKRCILQAGAASVLSASFDSFGSVSVEKNAELLEQILSALTWMSPRASLEPIGSAPSLRCLLWFLNYGDLRARQNAVVVLKELISSPEQLRGSDVLWQVEGIPEALIRIIREPICPSATGASLVTIFHMIKLSDASRLFLGLGLVPLLIDLLVDADKSVSEKALSVLDLLCDTERGREVASANALVLPLLVKKIQPVSNSVTELSVSVMWKLVRDGTAHVGEALETGAFEKLLVLLQVGCGETAKDKVKQLLKSMNSYGNKLGCVDPTVNFKYLKR